MERVEAEIRARGETLASFAERIGVRSQDINNWKHRGIPRAKQKRVAEALGWSLDRLLADEGEEPIMSANRAARSLSVSAGGTSRVYPGASGSRALETRDGESFEPRLWSPTRAIRLCDGQVVLTPQEFAHIAFTEDWLTHRGWSEDDLALHQVQGSGMEPVIRTGDLLLVDLADRTPTEGGLFLVYYARLLVVRRIHLVYDGTWILRASNRDSYPDQSVPPPAQDAEVQILGRVCWRGGEM